MLRFTKKQGEEEKKREITLDMLQPSRYKPNNLQQMADDTKFSKSESSKFLGNISLPPNHVGFPSHLILFVCFLPSTGLTQQALETRQRVDRCPCSIIHVRHKPRSSTTDADIPTGWQRAILHSPPP
jgi:hypothetical protein